MSSSRRTFLRRVGVGSAALSVGSLLPIRLLAGEATDRALPRSSPESQGVSSAAITSFLAALARSEHELHSLMIVRHGRVVAEGWWRPYRAEAIHLLYSLSKSATSTAVGFAIAEGRLSLDDRVTEFFPGELPPTVSDNLAALRVRDLLTMSVGHAQDSSPVVTKETDWAKTFLSLPLERAPGTMFVYESTATYMLCAILQRLSGEKVIDYLRPRLFNPLGIERVKWEVCPRGMNTGGWGLSMTTESVAKFLQVYLQGGRWQGTQIIPADWVQAATKLQVPTTTWSRPSPGTDWEQGYGYQFWRCRHNAFRADGAFGQFGIALPEQDMVVAITSRTSNLQGLLNLVWEHVLPAARAGSLPPDLSAQAELTRTLASLALPLPQGSTTSSIAPKGRSLDFTLEPNSLGAEKVSIHFDGDACLFDLKLPQQYCRVQCGVGNWRDSVVDMRGTPPELTVVFGEQDSERRPTKVAAAGAWRNASTFEMHWRYFETPHDDHVTCRFETDGVRVEFMNSITRAAGVDKRPVLQGRRIASA